MTIARRVLGMLLLSAALHAPDGVAAATAVPAAVPESTRMLRAKDLMAEDQWAAAIALLREAVADPGEPNKDEALFWLAHSQNRVGDLAESVESIQRLQREHPKSRWTAPGYSLLIELAHKLGRNDVLWRTAAPLPPPPAAAPSPPARPRPARAPFPTAPPDPVRVPPAASPPSPAAPLPPAAWLPETYHPDDDLRVQALSSLIDVDAEKAIPILRHIALDNGNLAAARRAVFVLAQSRNPDAQTIVADVAKKGPEPVRVAAVRELARFGGEGASQALLQVYAGGNVRVKQQVVISLGERAEAEALMKIAQSEQDRRIRDHAILALGRARGTRYLRRLYAGAPPPTRRTVIRALFTARDEEGLVGLAEREKDALLRKEILSQLRLLGTPAARDYLEKQRK